MASCWLVQLFSLDPLFLIFRDVMFQGWRLTVSSLSVGGNVETFLIFATFLCFSDLHRVATLASCWLVQLCSLHPMFPIFRDVIFQGWRLAVSSMSVGGNVETFFIFAIFLCLSDLHRVATMASCWLEYDDAVCTLCSQYSEM